MRRSVFLSTFLFVAVLSPITLNSFTCAPPADARLTVLELRVGDFHGENVIENFSPNVFSYFVRFPEEESVGVLWVRAKHPSASVDVLYNGVPVQLIGQSVAKLDIPLGSSELTIDVETRRPPVVSQTYVVRIERVPCPPPVVDAPGIPMVCRNSFNQVLSTFGVDLTVALDDCAFAGQPFNATVDPALVLDTTFLSNAAQTLCNLGFLMTSVDVTNAQISVDAIAGATCTEQLAVLPNTPVTVPVATQCDGTCGDAGVVCTVTEGITLPLPSLTVPCTADAQGEQMQFCSTGTVPLFISLGDPPPPPAYTQTYISVSAAQGAIQVAFACNTSSITNPPPGEQNQVGCAAPNPEGICDDVVGIGNTGQTPYPISDCDLFAPPATPQDCGGFDCPGTCTAVPVAVDPSTVCATFPVVPGLCEGVDCDDQNECTEDVCNPLNGVCEWPPSPDGASCSLGYCASGVCISVEPLESCAQVLNQEPTAPSGIYSLDLGFDSPKPVYCDMDHEGGGWTLVASMDGWDFCGADPLPEYDLLTDPTKTNGKIPDAVVEGIRAGSGSYEVMYYLGLPGPSEYLWTHIDSPWSTLGADLTHCTWTCADGNTDSTTCEGELRGCGFGGSGSPGDAKKLYMGFNGGLHSGGGFCGLASQPFYPVQVFMR